MWRGERKVVSLNFRNSGRSDLIIHGWHGSCGCLQPNDVRGIYAPGAQITVEVTFNSENFSGATEKTLMFRTNAKKPITTIKFSAQIEEEISAQPPILDFGKNIQGAISKTRATKILLRNMQNIEIVNLESLPPFQVKKVNDQILEVSFNTDQVGTFRGEIKVVNTSKHLPKLPIRVLGQVDKAH